MKKGLIITAVMLILLGITLFAGAFAAAGFDFSKLGTMKFKAVTYSPEEDFKNIRISTGAGSITIKPANDGRVSAESFEGERLKHSVSVEGDTLVIEQSDARTWYDRISFFNPSPALTLCLPAGQYGSLYIECDTGKTEISDGFTFETLEIKGGTGDVYCGAGTTGGMKIALSTGSISLNNCSAEKADLSASTGNISLYSFDCAGDISVTVSTGRTTVDTAKCNSFYTNGSTGDVRLKDLFAADCFDIERSTGSVRFDNCDAAAITVKTSTGSVTGTLASEKVFIASSSTGSVNVPKTASGGKCEITTSTGKIDISLLK
ncbi:MAG: DUF4097 family beta strand repeat protein [Clostridia bacterium]|nr:DUF4097 family beta strand repeat protein [Clostridia bacterium]